MTDALQAESDIRRLLALYTDAIYRLDIGGLAACWAPDGVWHAFGQRTGGREAIIDWLASLSGMFDLIWQTAHGVVLEIDGDAAEGRVYIDEITRDLKGTRRKAHGIYHDRYRRIDGRWLFAERHWSLLYLGAPDLSGRFWEMPSFGPPPHDPAIDRPNRPTLEQLRGELGL